MILNNGIMKVTICPGHELAPLAGPAYGKASEEQKAQTCWDAPLHLKVSKIISGLCDSPYACHTKETMGETFTWIVQANSGPFYPDGGSACLHLFVSGQVGDLQWAASQYFEFLKKHFATLYCLVPAPFVGMARLLASIGFERKLVFPKSCFIASRLLNVNGVLYVSDLRG